MLSKSSSKNLTDVEVKQAITELVPKVAPLIWAVRMVGEWEKACNDNYEVLITSDNKGWNAIVRHPFLLLGNVPFNSIKEAKAACQSYHETFILSQLV